MTTTTQEAAVTETLRLRAYGVLHGVALRELDEESRAALLVRLRLPQVRIGVQAQLI